MKSTFIRNLAGGCTILFALFLLCTPVSAAEETLTGSTVNINSGTFEELAQVPLITKEMAQAIIDYREDMGDFQQLNELLDVEGFNRNVIKRIEPFLLLEGIGGDACTC
ncbi:MAG: helix-hairpin-helix domain-containing protein [Deltaproteobacteria bacterium]|nr:helix-hairpin-helix domain-containing protein [Deltaproteobacteria bacterium]